LTILPLDRATKLGCLDKDRLDEMRHGQAPPCPSTPNQIHPIIPRARVPELDNVIANLELLPQGVDSAKQDKMGSRQRTLAKDLRRAGLLSC
jgi:hypothetical protein